MGDKRFRRVLAAAAALALVLFTAACTSSASTTTTTTTGASSTTAAGGATTTSGGVSASGPGVSATQINIGAISSRTGPLAGDFDGIAPGMIAYFKVLDAAGGINGRKLVLAYNLDDGGQPSQFTQDAHTLIDQDHAFAIGVASAWFSPNYFVSTKTPTYGYNVTGNWETASNLFAVGGSTQIYSAGVPGLAYFINQTHTNTKGVAFISYGPVIASSYDACKTFAADLKTAGYNVNFVDVSAQLSGSYTSDVQRMKQAGSGLVISCMQGSDNVTLARDIQQYGLNIKEMWSSGYDQTLLNQYSSVMQGVYLSNTGSVPFEAADAAKYGTTYAGMQQYISAMNKYEPAFTYNGVAFQGWQSAALLAAGIKAAGNDLTQANLIAQTNKITDFNGGGLSAPVNWTTAHTESNPPNCTSWLQVVGKKFVPVFAPGKQIFVCVGGNPKNAVPVTPPPGTPGA